MLGPELLVAVEPLHGFLHRAGGKLHRHSAPGLGARNQARVGKHVEVLHHGGKRHRERLREFAHRNRVALGETRKQCASGRVGERCEGAVEMRGCHGLCLDRNDELDVAARLQRIEVLAVALDQIERARLRETVGSFAQKH